MASPFQDINSVIQAAVSSAKEFTKIMDYNDDDFDDEVSSYSDDSFEEHGFDSFFNELYDGVFRLSVSTYVNLVS